MGRVLSDRILVEPKELKKEEPVFYVHESKKSRPLTGEVHAIGPDVVGVNVGDMIQFGPSAGTPTLVEGKSWLILRLPEVDLVWK